LQGGAGFEQPGPALLASSHIIQGTAQSFCARRAAFRQRLLRARADHPTELL